MLYENAKKLYLVNCETSGKSKNTIESYERTLRFFGDYLSGRSVCNIDNITPSDLMDWKNKTATEVSSPTLRLYVTHLKGFFDFCFDMEFIPKNPFKKRVMEVVVKDTDRKDTTGHVLPEACFRPIFTNRAPSHTHRKAIERNRAILALLLTSGIRCENLCRLTLSDLFFMNGRIRIVDAKGGKNGEALFSGVAQKAVLEYIESGYRPDYLSTSDTLFGFFDGNGIWNPYSRNQMSTIVEAAVRGFTGKEGFRAHSMRHTCASVLSNNGLTDGEISTFLLHSDGTGAQVTNRYIARDNTALFAKADAIFYNLIFC